MTYADRPPVAVPQRGVLVSTGSQLIAKIIHLGLNVVSSLALIHYMTPGEYGDYIFVITVAAVVGLISDFGLNKVAVRDIAQARDREDEVLGTVLTARLSLSAVAFVITQLLLALMGASGPLRA